MNPRTGDRSNVSNLSWNLTYGLFTMKDNWGQTQWPFGFFWPPTSLSIDFTVSGSRCYGWATSYKLMVFNHFL